MANAISFDLPDPMQTNTQERSSGSVTGAPLAWLRWEGLLVFILSIVLYAHSAASWWRFGLLLLTPDIAMAGYWLNTRWGALLYNGAHSYVGPLALGLAASFGSHPQLMPYALIWTTHIAMDRALGYGLKYPESFKTTHLGTL